MNTHLDIVSLSNSDFYNNNQRINWYCKHNSYDIISQEVYELLRSIKFESSEYIYFKISFRSLFQNISSYLSFVFDYHNFKKRNIVPSYSKHSYTYIDPIWKNKPINQLFDLKLHYDRFSHSNSKNIYAKFIEKLPKNCFKYIICSQNDLVKQFLKSKKSFYLNIYPFYHFKLNTTESKISLKLSNLICSQIINFVNDKHFTLTEDQKESLHFISNTLIARCVNDINNYNGFLKNTKRLITSNGLSYFNRLTSYIARIEGAKVLRFNHGGERCFYDDKWYWDEEFYETDIYYTYGAKWGHYLSNKSNIRRKNIKIKCIGSHYHNNLFQKNFHISKNIKKNILYVPNSFVGEARQFPFCKLIDPILYDFQKYIITILQEQGFDVIYKAHPKGVYEKNTSLFSFANNVSFASISSHLSDIDTVILDSAGSAFVDALCSGKNVILINIGQRKFCPNNFNQLIKNINILNAEYDNNNIIINQNELLYAINNNKVIKKEFVSDFYLK